MLAGRPGPVNLDVPLNVFVEEADVAPPEPAPRVVNGTPGDPRALSAALDVLLAAERPVIIAGQGVLLAEAAGELRRFVERTAHPRGHQPERQGRDRRAARARVRLDRPQRHLRGQRRDAAMPTSSWRSASPSTTARPAPGSTAIRSPSRRAGSSRSTSTPPRSAATTRPSSASSATPARASRCWPRWRTPASAAPATRAAAWLDRLRRWPGGVAGLPGAASPPPIKCRCGRSG